MALVTVSSTASMDTSTGSFAPQITGDLYAGEDLFACAAVQLKSDGKVWLANATAADSNAVFLGIVPELYKAGEAVAVYSLGACFRYADSGLTPGAKLYLGATAGRLDTAATTGDAVGVARCINATDIQITRII